MNFSSLRTLGYTAFVVSSITVAAPLPASLMNVLWSCKVPCESQTGEILGAAQFGYCATHVQSPEMVASIDSLCQTINHRPDAHAVRLSQTLDATDCTTSGNACDTKGLAYIGWQCSMACSSDTNLVRKFAVCSKTFREALSLASKICPDAHQPSAMAYDELCVANGQTPCKPTSQVSLRSP